jgi:hypothetical protein
MPVVRSPRKWLICIVSFAALAFLLKTALALTTYGTNDVMTWEQDLVKLDTRGPAALYREGVQTFSATGEPHHRQAFIHPPLILHVLRFWQMLAMFSNLPMRFWMRFTCALADIGSLVLVWRIAQQQSALRFRPASLLLFAACPISILVSGFHGNTDPIMMFLVLLSIYAVETKRHPLLSGSLMGFALSIKLVPIVFVPACLLYLPQIRSKCHFTTSALAVSFLCGLPYLLLDPVLIIGKLVTYDSFHGIWGFSAISASLVKLPALGRPGLLVAILLVSIGMNASTARFSLFAQCGLITCLLLFCAPGFGLQYLSWLVPWVVYLSPLAGAAYYMTGGLLLFVVYTHWSGRFPWYLANALEIPGWSKSGFYLGLACWLVIGIVLLLFIDEWLKYRKRSAPSTLQKPSSTLRDPMTDMGLPGR